MFVECLCFFAALRANMVGRLLRSDKKGACKESRTQTQDVHVETGCLRVLAQFEWLYQAFLVHPAAFRDAFLWSRCSIVIPTGRLLFHSQGQVLVPRVASSAQHGVCSSREHRSPFGLLWNMGRRAQGFAGRACSPRGQDGREEEAALCTSEPYHLRGERRGQRGTRPRTRDLPPLDSRASPSPPYHLRCRLRISTSARA